MKNNEASVTVNMSLYCINEKLPALVGHQKSPLVRGHQKSESFQESFQEVWFLTISKSKMKIFVL